MLGHFSVEDINRKCNLVGKSLNFYNSKSLKSQCDMLG